MADHNPVESLDKRFFTILPWGMWIAAAVAISILVVVHRNANNGICTMFDISVHSWWTGKYPVYFTNTIDGFLYFPQFLLVYTPFTALGSWIGGIAAARLNIAPGSQDFALLASAIGGIAWRLAGLAIYCAGLWRLAKLLSPKNYAVVFAFGTFAAIAPTIASFRSGQANLHVAGFLLNLTVELARRRWALAALYLVLGLAVKPIIFVALLLAAAIYRPMRWRLALGLLIFLLVPFAVRNPHYVWDQYRVCASKLFLAALPDRPFCDLRGLLWTLGWIIPQNVLAVFQIIAAIATLALCLLAWRWWNEPARSMFVTAFGACYLMLFNPRTESNSYVILASIFAIPTAVLLLDDLRPFAGIMLIVIGACFCCDFWAYHQTDPWFKPLTCAVLIGFLIAELFRRDPNRRRAALAAAVNSTAPSAA
jgi:hypothetical protein